MSFHQQPEQQLLRRDFLKKFLTITGGGVWLSNSFAEPAPPLKDEAQTVHIDWKNFPTPKELQTVLPDAYKALTGKDLEDRVSSINSIPWDEIKKVGEGTRAYYNLQKSSITYGVPSKEDLEKLPNDGAREQSARSFWNTVFHELGHANKVFSSLELKPLYEKLNCRTTYEKRMLAATLTDTAFLDRFQSKNILGKIEVDIAISEMYAILFSLGAQLKLEKNSQSKTEMFKQSALNHMAHFSPHAFSFDVDYDRSYVMGEYLGLALTKAFGFDVEKTIEFMDKNDISTIVNKSLETIGLDINQYEESNTDNILSRSREVKFKGKLPGQSGDIAYAQLKASVEGIAKKYSISISGIEDCFSKELSQQEFQKELLISLRIPLSDLAQYMTGQLDIDKKSIFSRLFDNHPNSEIGGVSTEQGKVEVFTDDTFHQYVRLRYQQTLDSDPDLSGVELVKTLDSNIDEISSFLNQHKDYKYKMSMFKDVLTQISRLDRMLEREDGGEAQKLRGEINLKLMKEVLQYYGDNDPKNDLDFKFWGVGLYALAHKSNMKDYAIGVTEDLLKLRERSLKKKGFMLFLKNYYVKEHPDNNHSPEKIRQYTRAHPQELKSSMTSTMVYDFFIRDATLLRSILAYRDGNRKDAFEILQAYEALVKLHQPPDVGGSELRKSVETILGNDKDNALNQIKLVKAHYFENEGKTKQALELYRDLKQAKIMEQIDPLWSFEIIKAYDERDKGSNSFKSRSMRNPLLANIDPLSSIPTIEIKEYASWRVQVLEANLQKKPAN